MNARFSIDQIVFLVKKLPNWRTHFQTDWIIIQGKVQAIFSGNGRILYKLSYMSSFDPFVMEKEVCATYEEALEIQRQLEIKFGVI